jgi:signal transduction histidine kinase
MDAQESNRNDSNGHYFAALYQISQTLNSLLNLPEVLNAAMDTVIELMRAQRGFIMLVDKDTGDLEVQVSRNIESDAASDFCQISRTAVQQALEHRQPVLTMNAQEDPRFAEQSSVITYGLRSLMCAPLLVKEQLIGVVYLDNPLKVGAFWEQDVEMLNAFANIAAIAIENARLHEDLKRRSEEQLRLQEELHKNELARIASEESKNLMIELSRFVSHELANPLTAVAGHVAHLLNDRGVLDHRTRTEFYEVVALETHRMSCIVRDLRDYGNILERGHLQMHWSKVDLAALMTRVARCHQIGTARHRIEVSLPLSLPLIVADRERVDQILYNLVHNAVKYSDGGLIRIQAREENESVLISVADEGVGLSPEEMARLFQRFERTEAARVRKIRGTGLGLYLVKYLAETHGGEVWVESEKGRGSTFFIRLPKEQPDDTLQREQP